MRLLSPFLVILLWPVILSARQITIGQAGDYARLSDLNELITAGDTLLLLDALYQDGTQFLENWHGSAQAPVVIQPASGHTVIFRGGTEALHLVSCSYVVIEGLIVEQQTGNGINIDDGGNYDVPTHHITLRNCVFRDMAADGNNDLLKLSGLDDFLVEQCTFINGGDGGSGIDMVGCHHGTIQDNYFDRAGVSGIQAKGGTQYILIQRNILKDMGQRAVNLGGSTGLEYFRPPLSNPIRDAFEAADLDVYSNVFVGTWSPIAYVGSIRVNVINNTIYHPENWVFRILQETTEPGFLACANNVFQNNLIVLEHDLTEVNVGPNTDPESFTISHNLWFNESTDNWSPTLPVNDPAQLTGDPLLFDPENGDFQPAPVSPVIGKGKSGNGPETDFLGKPFQDPPSIGAIEGSMATTLRHNTQLQEALEISPSIGHDYVKIRIPVTEGMLQIVSVDGRLLEIHTVRSQDIRVDISQYPAGIYWATWLAPHGKSITGKFIKE
ncbi:MAG: right-handed parallel beta-helix repeat-containing protein [Saprospiraceae bacterium]|nr:right-handed parallel beta-helix repeat-containing protein [Saprospiraceae bacterium]MCB9320087.1 right-handed parallel beta-helix repeat-containing protein [Lewinellaceae bacterium]